MKKDKLNFDKDGIHFNTSEAQDILNDWIMGGPKSIIYSRCFNMNLKIEVIRLKKEIREIEKLIE